MRSRNALSREFRKKLALADVDRNLFMPRAAYNLVDLLPRRPARQQSAAAA
jgi:hypothetical protein